MRLAIVLVGIASPALAQEAAPGTGGDPLRELMVHPALVNTALPVLAIHGGNPEDTVLLFEGFELPFAFHSNGVRSIFAPGALGDQELLPSGFGVEYGRGSSVLTVMPRSERLLFVDATPIDVAFHSLGVAARLGWNRALEYTGQAGEQTFGDAIGRTELPLGKAWTVALALAYANDVADFYRFVLTTKYERGSWRASIAASYLDQQGDFERSAIDTRGEAIRTIDSAAGLSQLEWRFGQQTNSNHYATAMAFWQHDVGAWSSLAGNLSERIRVTAGVRVDNFDGDVATQPRASLVGKPTNKLSLALAGGAYRRPPNLPHEVEHDLNPERATHVATAARYEDRGLTINAMGYYIDRRRLVIRDQLGVLRNTGLGSSTGIEVHAQLRDGAWFGGMSTALTRSKRFDFLHAAERPSEYEQPFRLDLLGAYYRKNLIVSGRLQLASGLPYTPYDGAIYNSDTDTYEPLYVAPLSARAPFHHQIDLRVDYRWRITSRVVVDAFLDLHNVYRNRDAIAYRYSYDYSQRTAITALPLFPFVGLRAYL